MQLIECECSIKLSVRGVGNYLRRWGFTPQKPIKKAYEQRPEAVKDRLDNEYPAIEQRAKAEGAEIHWGFDPVVVNTDVRGRCYVPAGKTPVTFAVGGTGMDTDLACVGYGFADLAMVFLRARCWPTIRRRSASAATDLISSTVGTGGGMIATLG